MSHVYYTRNLLADHSTLGRRTLRSMRPSTTFRFRSRRRTELAGFANGRPVAATHSRARIRLVEQTMTWMGALGFARMGAIGFARTGALCFARMGALGCARYARPPARPNPAAWAQRKGLRRSRNPLDSSSETETDPYRPDGIRRTPLDGSPVVVILGRTTSGQAITAFVRACPSRRCTMRPLP